MDPRDVNCAGIRWRLRVAMALFVCVQLAGAVAAAPASAPFDPGAQARKILSDPRYQRALPGVKPEDRGEGRGQGPSWSPSPAGDVVPGDRAMRKALEVPAAGVVLLQCVLLL